mmetsp:Transcript_27260/g.42347  ORF Transcript_27260/g.42347 Transcript_27260/m.42347 type:complete len:260 (+) Transcript_27260:859-1638(+)
MLPRILRIPTTTGCTTIALLHTRHEPIVRIGPGCSIRSQAGGKAATTVTVALVVVGAIATTRWTSCGMMRGLLLLLWWWLTVRTTGPHTTTTTARRSTTTWSIHTTTIGWKGSTRRHTTSTTMMRGQTVHPRWRWRCTRRTTMRMMSMRGCRQTRYPVQMMSMRRSYPWWTTYTRRHLRMMSSSSVGMHAHGTGMMSSSVWRWRATMIGCRWGCTRTTMRGHVCRVVRVVMSVHSRRRHDPTDATNTPVWMHTGVGMMR